MIKDAKNYLAKLYSEDLIKEKYLKDSKNDLEKFLKDKADELLTSIDKSYLKDEKYKLTNEEQKQIIEKIKNNYHFNNLCSLMNKTPNYVYIFATFLFDEETINDNHSLIQRYEEEIKPLYNKVLIYKDCLSDLPHDIYKYTKKYYDKKPAREQLYDDLLVLEQERTLNKFMNKFVSKIKSGYNPAIHKEKLKSIATSFQEISERKNIDINISIDTFYRSISSSKDIDAFIIYANNFIKGLNNDRSHFGLINLIGKIKDKLNNDNCLDIEYENSEDEVLLVHVANFNANKLLNSNLTHCIVNSQSQFDNYNNEFKKQYYVYNGKSDTSLSIIGFNLNSNGLITHAFDKLNHPVSNIVEYLKQIKAYDYVKPYTSEQIERFKLIKTISDKIWKDNSKHLTLDDLKEAYSLGVNLKDSTYNKGAHYNHILLHACEKNDIEMIKFLIDSCLIEPSLNMFYIGLRTDNVDAFCYLYNNYPTKFSVIPSIKNMLINPRKLEFILKNTNFDVNNYAFINSLIDMALFISIKRDVEENKIVSTNKSNELIKSDLEYLINLIIRERTFIKNKSYEKLFINNIGSLELYDKYFK